MGKKKKLKMRKRKNQMDFIQNNLQSIQLKRLIQQEIKKY